MIKKLQMRFIRISVIALSVAIILVVIIVNLANWVSVKRELGTTLDFIAEGDDMFSFKDMPEDDFGGLGFRSPRVNPRFNQSANRHERNMLVQSSWYAVYFDESGCFKGISGDNALDDDDSSVIGLAEQLCALGRESGVSGDYMYKIVAQSDGGRAVFLLNCETRFTAMNKLMLISLVSCLGAIVITFLIVSVASRRAVAPTIKNMEQQKQFITNASHELKTPLTVISTNMELLDMEVPGNQWVSATKKQTNVMRRLVDELVYLSRMEEENAPLDMETVDLNALINEVAEPFEAMAEFSGREFNIKLEDNLKAVCDRASVQRLFSTLCDNAMKYAEGDGAVEINGRTEGKYAVIEVSNEVSHPLDKEQLSRLFDRFYRADPSRSKDKKNGFGIGLAIARAIAEKHSGSIYAEMKDVNRLSLICKLPVKGAQ